MFGLAIRKCLYASSENGDSSLQDRFLPFRRSWGEAVGDGEGVEHLARVRGTAAGAVAGRRGRETRPAGSWTPLRGRTLPRSPGPPRSVGVPRVAPAAPPASPRKCDLRFALECGHLLKDLRIDRTLVQQILLSCLVRRIHAIAPSV